jgi:hypothetical protein
LQRATFSRVAPLRQGFERIAALLKALGRPRTAFCACELNAPAPFTEDGFRRFNAEYVDTLEDWDIVVEGINPIARSNTCPVLNPPVEPGFHAFTFTMPDPDAAPSFVVAGSGEAAEGHANYRDHIVAPGDASPAGMRAKAVFVLNEMERRMAALDATWADASAVQVYTAYDIHPFLADEVGRRGAARNGVTWHLNRPPIVGLDFEMDCRCVAAEQVLHDLS